MALAAAILRLLVAAHCTVGLAALPLLLRDGGKRGAWLSFLGETSKASTSSMDLPPVKPPAESMQAYCGDDGPKEFEGCRFLFIHDVVEANFNGEGLWYTATVTVTNEDGTFTIRYQDGREEFAVNCTRLRMPVHGYQAHDWVEVEWKGYDKWYMARVTAVNPDGSYNIVYKDDGMLEDNVPNDRLRAVVETVGPKIVTKDDPVCEIAEAVEEVNENVDEAQKEVINGEGQKGNEEGSLDGLKQLGPPHYKGKEAIAEAEAEEEYWKAISKAGAPAPASAQAELGGPASGDGEDVGIGNAQDGSAAAGGGATSGGTAADGGPGAGSKPSGNGAGDAAVGAAGTTMPPEVLSARIKAMREEILGRTDELIARHRALGLPTDELLQDLHSQDNARLGRDLPTTPEEMAAEIQRLEATIKDRAMRLEETLDKEKALAASGHEAPEPLSRSNMTELVGRADARVRKIEGTIAKLKAKVDALDAAGKLDPELKLEVERLLSDSGALSDKMEHAKGLLRRMLAESGEDSEAARLALEADLAELSEGLLRMHEDTQGFGRGVIPVGRKWWRFRWEYSFVEALIICLLCLLAAFWSKVHDLCRRVLGRKIMQTPLYVEEYFPHIALATWLRYMMGVLVVLSLVNLSLWLLIRLGLFHLCVATQFFIITDINLPTDPAMYVDISFDVAQQLTVAMILFFLLTLQVCYQAVRNDRDCKNLEEKRAEELRRQPVSEVMIGKFAATPTEYAALKQWWFEGVVQRCDTLTPRGARGEAQKVRDVLDARGVLTGHNHDAFPMWYFISQRVRKGVESTFTINAVIWLYFFLTFAAFAFLHKVLHVAYIRISIVLALTSLAVFIYMIVVVRKMRSVHDNSLVVRASPMAVVACFQYPLFFLCFVATRLVLSTWVWVYFFWLALAVLAIVAVFFSIFPAFIAPLVVTYLIHTSFPPHTDSGLKLVEHTLDERELALKRAELREKMPHSRPNTPRTELRSSLELI